MHDQLTELMDRAIRIGAREAEPSIAAFERLLAVQSNQFELTLELLKRACARAAMARLFSRQMTELAKRDIGEER